MLPVAVVKIPSHEDLMLQGDLGIEGPVFADAHVVNVSAHVMNGVSSDKISMGIIPARKEWWQEVGRSEQRIGLKSECLDFISGIFASIRPAKPKKHRSESHCYGWVAVEDTQLFLEFVLGPDIVLVEICEEFAFCMGDAKI